MDILTGQVSLAGEDALMGAKRKSYTPAYRRDAAHLVIDTGRTIAAVAREIGVGEQLLGRWVAAERARMDDPPGALDIDERAELERLRAAPDAGGAPAPLREPQPQGGAEVPAAGQQYVSGHGPSLARRAGPR